MARVWVRFGFKCRMKIRLLLELSSGLNVSGSVSGSVLFGMGEGDG